MNKHLEPSRQLPRSFAAHWVAATLAVLGAVAIQVMWPAAVQRGYGQRWWILLLVATAYLLATARFHVLQARWPLHKLAPRWWSLGRWMVADFVILVLAGMLVVKGHATPVFQAGLWLVPPVLVAVSGAAVVAGALALRDGMRWFGSDAPPAGTPPGGHCYDIARSLCFWLLAVALLAIR